MVENHIFKFPLIAKLTSTTLLCCPALVGAAWRLNFTEGVTSLSRDVYHLHILLLWICVAISIVVFGTMFFSIFLHRKSKGHEAHQFHHSTTAEIVWTIVPMLILIAMAVPATGFLLNLENVGDADITIKVTSIPHRTEIVQPSEIKAMIDE